jgi:hypothetical protein
MNEIQQQTIELAQELIKRLEAQTEINSIDELRLILIKRRIEESFKIIDDFGKQLFQGIER